ncbi:MAG: host-nuclease inhibitor Gam family protein [Roseomonas sp.]|nr:host-nuclease inhibitor Gam family protein [Roseomonas sp.]
MTRMKRKAEVVPAARNLAEATAWVARIGELQRQQQLIKAALGETIAAATGAADAETIPLVAEAERLHRGVQLWAEANRADLTNEGRRKTVPLASGVLCWRLPPPKVTLSNVDAVMQELRDRNLQKFIRTKQEPNKEAMLAEPGLAALIPGVRIGAGSEQFVIEPAEAPALAGAP